MIWIVSIVILVFIAGIIFFGVTPSYKKRTRPEFLKRFQELVEGKIVPIEGVENSYRVLFDFEGAKYIYEDVEAIGFKDKYYKTTLKTETQTDLNIDFVQKERRKVMDSKIFQASEVVDMVDLPKKVIVPKSLSEFSIITNNIEMTNKLFEDTKLLKIFAEFKNSDDRGHPFMSIRVLNGVVTLEFHSSGKYNPRPLYLHNNLDSLEIILDKMLYIAQKIIKLNQSGI